MWGRPTRIKVSTILRKIVLFSAFYVPDLHARCCNKSSSYNRKGPIGKKGCRWSRSNQLLLFYRPSCDFEWIRKHITWSRSREESWSREDQYRHNISLTTGHTWAQRKERQHLYESKTLREFCTNTRPMEYQRQWFMKWPLSTEEIIERQIANWKAR
jgi:hypothetical protein